MASENRLHLLGMNQDAVEHLASTARSRRATRSAPRSTARSCSARSRSANSSAPTARPHGPRGPRQRSGCSPTFPRPSSLSIHVGSQGVDQRRLGSEAGSKRFEGRSRSSPVGRSHDTHGAGSHRGPDRRAWLMLDRGCSRRQRSSRWTRASRPRADGRRARRRDPDRRGRPGALRAGRRRAQHLRQARRHDRQAVGGLGPRVLRPRRGRAVRQRAGTFILKADLGKGAAAHEH
jgi:hypothetical protein